MRWWRWIGGENLAFNDEDGDIAKSCVNQWINSRGHFENLVPEWFQEVVVGFTLTESEESSVSRHLA